MTRNRSERNVYFLQNLCDLNSNLVVIDITSEINGLPQKCFCFSCRQSKHETILKPFDLLKRKTLEQDFI